MRKLTLLLIALLLNGCLTSQQSYQENLRYNYLQNDWQYASPSANLKYNYLENKWQYAEPGESLRYNYLENRWEFSK